MTAKDSSGNNIGHGGDLFLIKITNKWVQTSDHSWNVATGTRTTIPSTIYVAMTDNGDGTYFYSFSVKLDGAISVAIKLKISGGVYQKWYKNKDWADPVSNTNISSNLNLIMVAGVDLTPGQNDTVSSNMYTTIFVPATDTYNFYFQNDDGSRLIFDDSIVSDFKGQVCVWIGTFSYFFKTGRYYDVEVQYYENLVLYSMILQWSSTTIPMQVIPATYFYYTEYVASSPYQLPAICPTGYTGNNPLSPTAWIEVWGDGLKVGTEECDDGNTISGDGWESDCSLVTSGFVCSGGGSAAPSVCFKWTRGLYRNSEVHPTAWVPKCGDGLRAGSEPCDDGNTSSGDGCSSSCSVETGYSCAGGSIYGPDTCIICQKGYYQDPSNPSLCITKCGDGIRKGLEKWDDGNTESGDGCASNWLSIENDWACVGGEYGITDYWTHWDQGYTSSGDLNKCFGKDISGDIKALATLAVVAAAFGICANMLYALVASTPASTQSSFGMMNQIQLLITLPLIGIYIPDTIFDYIKSMNSSLFNPSFLPTDNSQSIIDLKSYFKFEQKNSYLFLLGLQDGSALVNIISISWIVGAVVFIHILLLIIYWIFYKCFKLNFLKNFILKLVKMLTFGFYIGVYLETYLLFLFVDFSEIKYQQTNGIKNSNSMIASFVILGFMGIFILLVIWQWWKSRRAESFANQTYFLALFEGMKPRWICRSYTFVFIIRRSIFWTIVFFWNGLDPYYKVVIFTGVQVIYLLYILLLRPQEGFKPNFLDIINEVYYLYYIGFLLYFNSSSKWSSTTINIYFWTMLSNNFFLIFISISKLNSNHCLVSMIIAALMLIKRVWWRNKIKNSTKVENITNSKEGPSKFDSIEQLRKEAQLKHNTNLGKYRNNVSLLSNKYTFCV